MNQEKKTNLNGQSGNAEVKEESLYPKAKLIVKKIKKELELLEENLVCFEEMHGVGEENIEALEKLLEMAVILSGSDQYEVI